MRQLRVVDASDPFTVLAALRDALTADGPAVFPAVAPAGAALGSADVLPQQVAQRVALVVETSGSTGRPKRVALSADAVLASAAASETALGGAGQWLLALPAHYIAGVNVLARSITAELDPVLMPPAHFDPTALVDAASGMHADRRFTSLVPVQLARAVELAETDVRARDILRRFDRILVGGQATPPALLERAAALGLRVTRTYGSSETSGGCVYDGSPLATTTVRIDDGEVLLGGPMLAEEYLDDPERTAAAFVSRDGARWYRTSDAGSLDDGILSVTGRRDRVIISGGVKVSLDEVERLAREVPGHADAVAVPVSDARWGEGFVLVTAGVTLLPPGTFDILGPAGRPRRVATVEAIPTLASGKPDRLAVASLLDTL